MLLPGLCSFQPGPTKVPQSFLTALMVDGQMLRHRNRWGLAFHSQTAAVDSGSELGGFFLPACLFQVFFKRMDDLASWLCKRAQQTLCPWEQLWGELFPTKGTVVYALIWNAFSGNEKAEAHPGREGPAWLGILTWDLQRDCCRRASQRCGKHFAWRPYISAAFSPLSSPFCLETLRECSFTWDCWSGIPTGCLGRASPVEFCWMFVSSFPVR